MKCCVSELVSFVAQVVLVFVLLFLSVSGCVCGLQESLLVFPLLSSSAQATYLVMAAAAVGLRLCLMILFLNSLRSGCVSDGAVS